MTDLKQEDVMRALECHIKRRCAVCPFHEEEIMQFNPSCGTMIADLALALLREKDKEIERLQESYSKVLENTLKSRAEAVSEFAERLKKSHDILDVNGYSMIGVDIVELIAKELKGEKP